MVELTGPADFVITVEGVPRGCTVELSGDFGVEESYECASLPRQSVVRFEGADLWRFAPWAGYRLRVKRRGRTLATRWGVMPGETWRLPWWVRFLGRIGRLESRLATDTTATRKLDPEERVDWELYCDDELVAELLLLNERGAELAAFRQMELAGRSGREGVWLLFQKGIDDPRGPLVLVDR